MASNSSIQQDIYKDDMYYFASDTLPNKRAMLTPSAYLPEQVRVIRALREKQLVKFSCGASFGDYELISKYSEIFAKAGVHVISVAAHPSMVSAAKEGTSKANLTPDKNAAIMLSLSLDQNHDPRFKRVELNKDSCDNCGACVNSCPTKAFSITDAKLEYSQEKCYGCGSCLPTCHVDAFSMKPVPALEPEILPELWALGARFIEIHVGDNFYWLESYLKRIKQISPQPWVFSVFLSGNNTSYIELQEQAEQVYELLGEDSWIQIDGAPVIGASHSDLSTLRALASISAIMELQRPFYLQVSGGVTKKIKDLASTFRIKLNGIGIGSYAKQLVEPYLDDTDAAVSQASSMINSLI